MFIGFSKQKETPRRVVSSVAYYISVSFNYHFTDVHVLSTKCCDITVNVHVHTMMSMKVDALYENKEPYSDQVEVSNWG